MRLARIYTKPNGDSAIELREVPLLFIDDAPIATQSGVVRTYHPARTRPARSARPAPSRRTGRGSGARRHR